MTQYWVCNECKSTNDDNMTRTVCMECGHIKDSKATYDNI